MGGLAAAIDLARTGCKVTVLERAACAGGKLREIEIDGRAIDAGPTVITLHAVFADLFAAAGERLQDHLSLRRLDVLARHAWPGGARLDLHADPQRSAAAIDEFAGRRAAAQFREFSREAAGLLDTLQGRFMTIERPTPLRFMRSLGANDLLRMWQTPPWQTLWKKLSQRFDDPRLRQLFARYATYVGSSPLQAPATLMLIAHVEQQGVWQPIGGMRSIAVALESLGKRLGARYRYDSDVESIDLRQGRVSGVKLVSGEYFPAEIVIFNGDVSALANGRLGAAVKPAGSRMSPSARSLSAITWCQLASVDDFPLSHHNVFFANDYADEFREIFTRGAVTTLPTVYLCAQDRGAAPDETTLDIPEYERMLLLINTAANGDTRQLDAARLESLERRMREVLEACGAKLVTKASVVTRPQDFAELFPDTGGALYGRANHSAMASFTRPGSRTSIRGLYRAGGSTHPGPGIPMATLSGRLAAASAIEDFL